MQRRRPVFVGDNAPSPTRFTTTLACVLVLVGVVVAGVGATLLGVYAAHRHSQGGSTPPPPPAPTPTGAACSLADLDVVVLADDVRQNNAFGEAFCNNVDVSIALSVPERCTAQAPASRFVVLFSNDATGETISSIRLADESSDSLIFTESIVNGMSRKTLDVDFSSDAPRTFLGKFALLLSDVDASTSLRFQVECSNVSPTGSLCADNAGGALVADVFVDTSAITEPCSSAPIERGVCLVQSAPTECDCFARTTRDDCTAFGNIFEGTSTFFDTYDACRSQPCYAPNIVSPSRACVQLARRDENDAPRDGIVDGSAVCANVFNDAIIQRLERSSDNQFYRTVTPFDPENQQLCVVSTGSCMVFDPPFASSTCDIIADTNYRIVADTFAVEIFDPSSTVACKHIVMTTEFTDSRPTQASCGPARFRWRPRVLVNGIESVFVSVDTPQNGVSCSQDGMCTVETRAGDAITVETRHVLAFTQNNGETRSRILRTFSVEPIANEVRIFSLFSNNGWTQIFSNDELFSCT